MRHDLTKMMDIYNSLTRLEQVILQVICLSFFDISTKNLMNCLHALELKSASGKQVNAYTLKPIWKNLEGLGFIDKHYRINNPDLVHAITLAVVASGDCDHLLPAIDRGLNVENMIFYGFHITPEELGRRLRTAIYLNNQAELDHLMKKYFQGDHLQLRSYLATLFIETTLSPDWLMEKPQVIQVNILTVKLECFIATGQRIGDLKTLYEFYKNSTEQHIINLIIIYELMTGQLEAAEAHSKTVSDFSRFSIDGMIHFMNNRNMEAIAAYRTSLKGLRKVVGKTRVCLIYPHNIFFMLALLNQKDHLLYGEIERLLQVVRKGAYGNNICYDAIYTIIRLLQGQEETASTLLTHLNVDSKDSSFDIVVSALALYFYGQHNVLKSNKVFINRFKDTRDTLPVIAGMLAEVLFKVTNSNVYGSYIDAVPWPVRLCSLVQLKDKWERSLDSLETFFAIKSGVGKKNSYAKKQKRMAWRVNLEHNIITPVEQTLSRSRSKGSEGWSAGRNIALKRIYRPDAKLDYLTEHDRKVCKTLKKEKSYYSYYGSEEFMWNTEKAISALVGHPNVYDDNSNVHLELVKKSPELVITKSKNSYAIKLSCFMPEEQGVLVERDSQTRYSIINFSTSELKLQEMLGKNGVEIPASGKEKVLSLIRTAAPTINIHSNLKELDLPAVDGIATPCVQLLPIDDGLKLNMFARPAVEVGSYYRMGQGNHTFISTVDNKQVKVVRNLKKELSVKNDLLDCCPTLNRMQSDEDEWVMNDIETCLEVLTELEAAGKKVRIEWPEGEKFSVTGAASAGMMKFDIKRDNDWFRFDGELKVGEHDVIGMQNLIELMEHAKGRFIPLENGRFLALTKHFKKELEKLNIISEHDKTGMRVHKLGAFSLQDFAEETGKVKSDKDWKKHIRSISSMEKQHPTVPSTMQAELRDYQVEGFDWMFRLAHWGAGACLADDMGLGKTIQALAILLEHAPKGPALVVAPTSVCFNWEAETMKFCPTLTPSILTGINREELIKKQGSMDILICSYTIMQQEIKLLSKKKWQVVILDEAQAIKNVATKRTKASLLLPAVFKVALTGTPIENHLGELWSIFNFINPGLLGTEKSFRNRFMVPIENNNRDASAALKKLIQPFVLRRIKGNVLRELPSRTDQTILVEMKGDESAFYEALRRQAVKNIENLDAENKGTRKIHILAEITRLRRACCHPSLVDENINIESSKMKAFLRITDDLISNRHKALVFSQYVGHLNLVRQALDKRGINYQYLDGATPMLQRKKRVVAFQAGEGDLFLISLKAGGSGLNLTAADYVIHLDPWWNPAVEDQASDRAHRIGQQRPVTIYRLIMQNSIEEQMIGLHQHKRNLASDLLSGSEQSARLSEEELLNLIKEQV